MHKTNPLFIFLTNWTPYEKVYNCFGSLDWCFEAIRLQTFRFKATEKRMRKLLQEIDSNKLFLEKIQLTRTRKYSEILMYFAAIGLLHNLLLLLLKELIAHRIEINEEVIFFKKNFPDFRSDFAHMSERIEGFKDSNHSPLDPQQKINMFSFYYNELQFGDKKFDIIISYKKVVSLKRSLMLKLLTGPKT